ncbi:abscisic acid 8'-hydroxylase [Trifolium repens]|nr:abscisic acid 8'-hydroxylase [Trifolium repens]
MQVEPRPNTFMPFGNEVHSCPGSEMAKPQEYVHGNQLSGSIVNKMIKFVLSAGISLLTTSRGIYRLSWVTSLILGPI